MPGHTFLYSPPVVAVRELVASGELGELQFISSSRVNLGLHQSDVSVVWDLGPARLLDPALLARRDSDARQRDRARMRRRRTRRRVHLSRVRARASSRTSSCRGSRRASFDARRSSARRRWCSTTTRRSEPVRIFDSGVQLREPETFGEYRLTYRTGDIVSPRVDAAEPLLLELRDFCDAVRTGAEPRSSATVGLEVVRIIEAVDASLDATEARVSRSVRAAGRKKAS